jgi:hypothetical protein
VYGAALALLGFSLVSAASVVAWFESRTDAFTWQSALTIFCAALALTTSALVWRAPSRTHAAAGLVVMLLSLVRLGAPSEWGLASVVALLVTLGLAVPLVRAVIQLEG